MLHLLRLSQYSTWLSEMSVAIYKKTENYDATTVSHLSVVFSTIQFFGSNEIPNRVLDACKNSYI